MMIHKSCYFTVYNDFIRLSFLFLPRIENGQKIHASLLTTSLVPRHNDK
ncbi:hypothetical protein B4113_1968 [Geobacillus sp. B4113_201601]|nr:hypothetical protein B4113_1968 [Geobacillus sp. B4113_201601]